MADSSLRILEIKVVGKTNNFPPRARAQKERRSISTKPEKMRPPLPIAKLIVLAACVSVLAALFLAALPDFQQEIVSFPARVEIFTVRYTTPICFFQLVVFWILYSIRKR
jgi:hypothetical protein